MPLLWRWCCSSSALRWLCSFIASHSATSTTSWSASRLAMPRMRVNRAPTDIKKKERRKHGNEYNDNPADATANYRQRGSAAASPLPGMAARHRTGRGTHLSDRDVPDFSGTALLDVCDCVENNTRTFSLPAHLLDHQRAMGQFLDGGQLHPLWHLLLELADHFSDEGVGSGPLEYAGGLRLLLH